MKIAIAFASTLVLACALCAPVFAQQPSNPPAAAPAPPAADKGAAPKTPEEKCLARSTKVLEQCRVDCSKDFNLQVRCTNKCESASAKRDAECKAPKQG